MEVTPIAGRRYWCKVGNGEAMQSSCETGGIVLQNCMRAGKVYKCVPAVYKCKAGGSRMSEMLNTQRGR
jgi:hypothetical protein